MLHTGPRDKPSFLLLFLLVLACQVASSSACFGEDAGPAPPSTNNEPSAKQEWIKIEFEPDAYYTNLGIYLALTKAPIPHVGEQSEKDLYLTLLSRAYAPRFLIVEGSVNPLPYAGTYIREHHENFYGDAQFTGSFNWVQAVTAGFEEPYAVSAFLGNVVDFSLPEDKKSKGIGYSGLLYSRGTYHIKDNTLVKDDWWELEWKVKGDRKTQDQKLSWSFRFGTKLHENPDITDIYYLSFRRSRLDFLMKKDFLLNNSGFEYTVDLERGTFTPIRHYFFVEKKWPFENRKMAFSLAAGFIWESAGKYRNTLATDHTGSRTQIILRPNIEF